jgi:hypothetical protein
MGNNFFKNEISTHFAIKDAISEMYHNETFSTEAEARKVIESEYTNRSKNDGSDGYWRNRKQVVIKVTSITEFLD